MATTESTAVNALIELSRQRPIETHGGDDLFASPAPARRPSAPVVATTRTSQPGIPAPPARTSQPGIAVPPPIPARASQPGIAVPPPIPARTSSPRISSSGLPVPHAVGAAPEPLPRHRAPAATQAPAFADDAEITEPHATLPLAVAPAASTPPAWVAQTGGPVPVPVPVELSPAALARVAESGRASRGAAPNAPAVTAPVQLIDGADWFQSSTAVVRLEQQELGTQAVVKARSRSRLVIAGTAGVVLLAGLGGFALLRGGDAAPVAAPQLLAEPAAPPAPMPAPAAALGAPQILRAGDDAPAIAAPVVAPTRVDVTFTSTPSGATVILLDDGRALPLGQTPLTASIDAARGYDVRFELDGRATRLERLEPTAGARLDVAFAAVAPVAKAAPSTPPIAKVAPAPAKPAPVAKAAPQRGLADPFAEPAAPKGDGTLLISAKPPCEIYVDGKATGLITPQRITASAGAHKITLVNAEHGIRKTVSTKVEPGKATKVVQDYTALIK